MLRKCKLVAAAACTMLVAAAPAGAATTWTPVTSGTTQDITAVEYRSDAQAWFGTGGGQLWTADAAGTFQLRRSIGAQSVTDIAFGPDGTIGLATTATGGLYRSIDGGQNWDAIVLLPIRRSCESATTTAVPRLNAVFWADPATAYAVGGTGSTEPIVLRSTNAGLSWDDANWIVPGGGCRLGVSFRPVTDGFAVPGDPNGLRFITEAFGGVWTSNDGLASASLTGNMISNTDSVPRFAVDGTNSQRIWAVDRGCGALCFSYSETGGASDDPMRIDGSPTGIRRDLYDVAYAGGTLVAVGDAGEIYTSVDGKLAYLQRAAAPDDGANWRAVDLADGTTALVGGAGGRLVKTTNANAIPTPPPVVVPPPVTPPARPPVTPPTTRPPVTRTPSTPRGGGATNPPNVTGNPTTQTTGGARVAYWKRVALSKGRYVPVRISARTPRRFVIEIRRARRPRRRIAMSKARLGRNGRALIRVPLRRSTRTGRYRIVVRVYKGRRAIGRRVDVAFLIVR